MANNRLNALERALAGNANAAPQNDATLNATLNAIFSQKKSKKKEKVHIPKNIVPVEERPGILLLLLKEGRFKGLETFFENHPDTDPNMILHDPDYPHDESLLCIALRSYTRERAERIRNIVRLLLQRGANPSSPCGNKVYPMYPIFRAIYLKDFDIFTQLLNAGANIDTRSIIKKVNATGYGNARRNNNNQNNQNNMPLSAIQINNVEYNNNSNLPLTPLQFAIERRQWNMVTELIRRGARVDINKIYPTSFLRNPEENDYEPMLDIDAVPLLITAIGLDDEELFRECVSHGADVNIRLERGLTPLMIAAGLGNADMVRQLIAQGADRTATTDGGITLGYYGQISEDPETLEVLRDAGVPLPAGMNNQNVPLNMEPPEPIPLPNPNVEEPEYEDYPSEDIPTVAVDRIPNPTEVFDTLMASDSTFEEVYSDDDNIIFRYGHKHGVNTPPDYKYFSYPRSEILKSLKKNELLRFPCNKSIERAPFLNQNVDIGTIYFIIQGPQVFLTPLSHIVGWINDSTKRIFDIVDTGQTTPTVTSWHSILEDAGVGLGGQEVNIRSSEHCNPGTEKRLYNLVILQMREAEAAAEGGRRRLRRHRTAHKKRMIPRRRVTRKYRRRITQRKKQHKKAHKSHKCR